MRVRKAEEDDIPHRAELAKEIEEFLWGDVEAATGLAHCRLSRENPYVPQVLYEESSVNMTC